MFRLNKYFVFLSIIAVLVLSLALSFLYHSYELAVSGLLIIVVLTALIPGWKSTLFAGVLSMIVMTGLVIYFKEDEGHLFKAMLSQVYSLLLIIFTVVIVFYQKRLQQNFAHEKTHMTSLFENATEGILLTDRSAKIVLANPAAEKMFGYSSDGLVGQTIETLIPQRLHNKHVALRDGFYQKPANRSMGTGRDLFARRKDDSEFPVEVSLSHYQQKNETFVIAFVVDITTRKEIEKNLLKQKLELEKISNDIRKLNAELEGKVEERTLILREALQKLEESQIELNESLDKEKQLNEIKSRFVSMASHEFRTPLSTILSSATLVSKYPATEEFDKREKHIRRIRDSVKHMNELLEDFLSLGKLEEGKVGITISMFNVKEFTDEIVEEMRTQLKAGQEIIAEFTGENIFTTDKRLLKNILLNLLSNAIKFSGEGKVIFLRTENSGGQLTLSVKDEGVGIPAEDLPHLFGTFFRAKNAGNIQGTGLGLAIIKRYTIMLGGSIELKTRLNEGTVVGVKLPELKPIMNKL